MFPEVATVIPGAKDPEQVEKALEHRNFLCFWGGCGENSGDSQ